MGDSGDSVAYLLALLLVLGMVGPAMPNPPEGQIVNPFSCKTLEGVIIDKQHDEEGQRLYVELFIKDEWEGHIIWVSNKTYNNYEIGYTYSERVCALVDYEEILSLYDDGIDAGWLIPTSSPTIAAP
jgi:hypothetical protein